MVVAGEGEATLRRLHMLQGMVLHPPTPAAPHGSSELYKEYLEWKGMWGGGGLIKSQSIGG